MSSENPTYEGVWERLSNVDVSEHIEVIKTNSSFQPKYLSWAWAWGVMMQHYSDFRFEFTQWEYPEGVMKDVLVHEDKSCMVEVTCRIGSLHRTMWLAVMNYKHESIPNPSTAQINKAKMRCLVKCMALYGLGHYIYAGEDLPEQPKEKPKKKPPAKKLKETAKKKPKPVLRANQEELNEPIDLRNDYIKLISEGLDSDVFDENNKASITNFLAGVTDTTTDQELEKWANRMQSLIKENK